MVNLNHQELPFSLYESGTNPQGVEGDALISVRIRSKHADAAEVARKASEEGAAKVREEFETYRRGKAEEERKMVTEARKVADLYQDLLLSVGEDADAPQDVQLSEFLRWLSGELMVLGEHMSVGRDYASMESLRAFAQAVTETGCDHLNN